MQLNNSLALAFLLFCGTLTQASGEAGGLAAQLRQHYRLATGKLDANGVPVIEPGKILTVRVEGIVGFAENVSSFVELCPSEFQAGELHVPKTAACTLTAPHKRRVFKVADPVCITAIDISELNDTVSLTLMACNRHHWGRSSGAYRALVVFRFPKSFVATASAARIEEVIGQVLYSGDADTSPETNASCDAPLRPVSDAATPSARLQGKAAQSKKDCGQPADPPQSQPHSVDPARGGQKAEPAPSPESPAKPAKPEEIAPVPEQPAQQPPPEQTVPPSKALPVPSQPPTSPDTPEQVPPIDEAAEWKIPDKAVAMLILFSWRAELGERLDGSYPSFHSGMAFEIQQI